MLQATPSLSLAKFLWSNSKPVPSGAAPMTVAATGEVTAEPLILDAFDDSLNNSNSSRNSRLAQARGAKSSTEEESSTLKIAGLREFWNHQMKVSEDKWKRYVEQTSSHQQHRAASYETEMGEVDWGAVRERIAWRWRLNQEKPDNMSIEEWHKLQEDGANLRPWFIYKSCGLYSRILYEAESRPIFQEFDFY